LERGYVCSNCGAPLDVTPETIVAICSYCGEPRVIGGAVSVDEIHVIPSLRREDVEAAFWRTVREDFDLRRLQREIELYEVRGVYVPVWLAKVRLEGRVSYYVEREGGKKREYRVEDVSGVRRVPVIARRQVAPLGTRELVEALSREEVATKRLVDVVGDEWRRIRLEVLNAEYDRRVALERVREDSLDALRAEFRRKGDGIDGFSVRVAEVEDLKLVLAPLWRAYYTYRDSVYQAVYAGWSGGLLVKTEPVTLVRRLAYFASAAALVLVTGVVTALILSQREVNVSSLGAPIFLAGLACKLSKSAIRGVRLERRGGGGGLPYLRR